ncbi:bacteriophage protein [Burkholderia pseudomallei]|nr:bacteriophage protein [Burkholderia pseudomallei]CAJ6110639.1 bacteriophage protein [Burkholderia pseudomallei]
MTTDVNNFDPRFAVTLAALRKAGACYEGYNKLVRSIQGKASSAEDADREAYIHFRHDAEIPLLDILKSNGLNDALWTLRCISDADRDLRLFAIWCARQVEHLMQDQCSKDALNVAERFANGEATDEERAAARDAARDAAGGAAGAAARATARAAARDAAWATAWGAAWAAAGGAAGAAARATARAAARDAAWDAAWATAWGAAWAAAGAAARATAWATAWDAAWGAALDAQKEMFERMCLGTAPWQQAKVAA